MPYIAVKMWPKSEADKQALALHLTKAVTDALDYPAEYVTVSIEEIAPDQWDETAGQEMKANQDKMYIVQGKKVKD